MTSSPRPASLGRRLMPAVALVGVSGALFTQLDHPTSVASAGTTSPARAAGSAGAARATAASTAAAGTVAPPATAGTLPPRAAPTAAATSKAATTAPAATAAKPAATAGSGTCGTPTNGPVVNTRWGPVQVAAGFTADGALCSVKTLQTPSSHGRSVQINNYAVPVLNQEATAAKSATIDIVSGATITSDAYAQSLQSILDTKG